MWEAVYKNGGPDPEGSGVVWELSLLYSEPPTLFCALETVHEFMRHGISCKITMGDVAVFDTDGRRGPDNLRNMRRCTASCALPPQHH